MAKKETKFKCEKCYRSFTTNRGRASHMRMHKPVYVPPPLPKQTTEVSQGTPYSGSYKNARHVLGIGDTFYRIEKHTVNEITITDGSNDLKIGSIITKSHWQANKPE